MNCRYSILLFTILTLFSCKTAKTTLPFKQNDFKNDNWLILYEKTSGLDKEEEIGQKQWILCDNVLIDSLKSEFKCDINKQSDCRECYWISLYKNHNYFDGYLFDNEKYFSLGQLKTKLISVRSYQMKCKNSSVAILKSDSLDKLNIPFVLSQNLRQPFQYTFKIKLDFKNVNDTTFLTRIQKMLWQENYADFATKELLRICPDITDKRLFVYGAGSYYIAIIDCNKDFKFDASKLKYNKIIRFYEMLGIEEKPYTITYFNY